VDAAGLQRSVAEYNAALGGADPFGREHRPAPIAEAPFYALPLSAYSLLSWPGIDVDSQLRVRRGDATTIPGLFAVGEALGGAALMGQSFCSGMMVGPAVALGRALGRQLASP
jgi:predicted oxidoreductase